MSEKFRVGDLVEVTEEWKRSHNKPAVEHRKNGGVILNVSRFKGCYRVEWEGLATPESIHGDFLKPKDGEEKIETGQNVISHREEAALTRARDALAEHGIHIAFPWEGSLDDREVELFKGLLAACRAFHEYLE